MSITLVNKVKAFNSSGTTFASLTTPSFTSTTGNLIVVYVKANTAIANVSVKDSNNTSFVKAVDDGLNGSIWYLKNITGTVGLTVIASFAGNAAFLHVSAIEYSGLDTVSPLDVAGSVGSGTGSTATSGAFTTTAANEVIVGGIYDQSSTTNVGSGTLTAETSDGSIAGMGDLIVSSIQTAVTVTLTKSTFGSWKLPIASFKAASASSRGLFTPSTLSGLGAGGSFFQNPLG